MANLFKVIRFFAYAAVFISSIVVLGLAINFGTKFLPNLHRPYAIFSLIVPSLTMLLIGILLLRSVPRTDALALFLLGVLWLTMGAWTEDVIGHIECFPLGGQSIEIKGGKTMSFQQYCYEMKTIEAFSWANFCILLISFVVLLCLLTRATSLGRYRVWEESISDLPWFGQWNAPGLHYGPPLPMQGGVMYGGSQMPTVIQQMPGHSVVIQPNAQGAPSVQQIPSPMMR